MRNGKRILAMLLAMALLAVPMTSVSAEESTLFSAEIQNSITDEEGTTGFGLAFLIRMNVSGVTMKKADDANYVNAADYTNATAQYNGETYSVVDMGAVMTNQADHIRDIDNLTIEDVTDNKTVVDVKAVYLYEKPAENSCAFAVRIIKLPDAVKGRALGCRPYVILQDENGEQMVVYADAQNSDIATYNQVYYAQNADETPVLEAGAPELDGKIAITAATAEYVAYDPATCVEAFKVNLTLSNISSNAKTSEGDTIVCSFKNAEGTVLGTTTIAVDELTVGSTKEVEVYIPLGTTTIEATELNLNYVPDIVMPAIGSDIDVTKQKNRIRVSATEASFNEDGTIHVKWTFKNYTSNWITEETDYIKYGYYKDDTRKGTATLYIGVIDTKKHPVKTFEFDVPAYTTEVRIMSSKIVYWTEWA